MEQNNLIEVELLEPDEVNVPSETVTSNVVPQDNSQQSEKTGENIKNKGKKSSFVIGVIFVVLVIGGMIALGSYNNDIIEKNNLRDKSSSASDYSSVSSSSSVDSNYDYSNDNSYDSDYDSDYSYNSSYDSDYDSDYSYNSSYDSDYDSDYDYSYDSGYDDYSYGSSDYEYFPGCYGLPKPDSVVSNIYYDSYDGDLYEYYFYSSEAFGDYLLVLMEEGYSVEDANYNDEDTLLYTVEDEYGSIEAVISLTYVNSRYYMYMGIM